MVTADNIGWIVAGLMVVVFVAYYIKSMAKNFRSEVLQRVEEIDLGLSRELEHNHLTNDKRFNRIENTLVRMSEQCEKSSCCMNEYPS